MTQDELKEVEKRILESHNVLLEYVNEIAVRINKLRDQIEMVSERITEWENNGDGKISEVSEVCCHCGRC